MSLDFILDLHYQHVYTYLGDTMKLRVIAQRLAKVLETEINRKAVPKQPPDVGDLRKLIISLSIGTVKPDVRYETEKMGAGDTIYLRVGPTVFALIQNWNACPDGLNRFLMVVPLYSHKDGHRYHYGYDEIPVELVVDTYERFVGILADLIHGKDESTPT